MQKFNKGVQIKPGLMWLVVIGIYMIPLKWLVGWIAAIAVHELSHILAIKAFGIKIKRVDFGTTGAIIETEPMKPWQEIVSAIAGPVGGFGLVFFGRQLPYCAVCAFIQSLYNLLPVYPLDGGRVLRCVLNIFHGEKRAARIGLQIGIVTVSVLLMGFLYCCYILSLGALPVIVVLLVALRLYPIKFPCKRPYKIVQ